jgi:hypothetical protein
MRAAAFFRIVIVFAAATIPGRLIAQSAKELPCVGYATFERNGGITELLGLAVGDVPAGSKVTLTCTGGGCPFGTKTINMKSSAGTVALTDMFIDPKLEPGMLLELRVTKPGFIGKMFQYEVRASDNPKSTTKCISEDGSKIMACLKESGKDQR